MIHHHHHRLNVHFLPWIKDASISIYLSTFHTNQLGLGKRHWNLETSSSEVEFRSTYREPYEKVKESFWKSGNSSVGSILYFVSLNECIAHHDKQPHLAVRYILNLLWLLHLLASWLLLAAWPIIIFFIIFIYIYRGLSVCLNALTQFSRYRAKTLQVG